MLNPELDATITIRRLERERDQHLAQSLALRTLAERRVAPVVKPLALMSLLDRAWRTIAMPRRQPAPCCAEAAA